MSESFDRLAAIVESSNDAIIAKTPDGTITAWNRAATQIFGYSADEAIGRHITMLFPPERLAEEEELMARIARGDCVEHFETQRVRKDGATVDVSVTLSPVHDPHGRIVEISKIARDISGRKRLEAQANEHAVRFRLMADSAPVMIWMSGPDTLRTFLNKPWLDFTGHTMEQEVGKGWADGVHPDDLERCLDLYRGSFHGRQPFQMEYRLRRADGQYRWVIDTGRPFYTAPSQFSGYIGSCFDVTEMKAAAHALASEVDTTRALFESAAEGIVIVNQAGHIARVNARAAQMFGYAPQELFGLPIDVLLPERFRAAHDKHRARYFAAPRTRPMGVGLDLFGLRKGGTEFPIEISLSTIETTEGLLAMALVTDISERRNLEHVTRHHERLAALATLSAGIAHELNNPIGIISTRLELMLDEAQALALPDQVVEDLNVLYRNIERVSRIARGLLSLAKQSTKESTAVNLNSVIEETLLLMGRMLNKEGIDVRLSLDRTLGPILGDGNAFQQVLTNLLLNARDAMPGGGHVQIETARDSARVGWLRLTVADTGQGMPSDVLEKIWEPFYTTKSSGSGLGLSVSARIIREHGGVVDVRSELGRGTTFVILLPSYSSLSTA